MQLKGRYKSITHGYIDKMADRLSEFINAITDNENPDHVTRMRQLLALDPRLADQKITHGADEGTTAMYHATQSRHEDGFEMMKLLKTYHASVDLVAVRGNNLLHDICAWIPKVIDKERRMRWVLETSKDKDRLLTSVNESNRNPLQFAQWLNSLPGTASILTLIEILEDEMRLLEIRKAMAFAMINHERLGQKSNGFDLKQDIVAKILHIVLDE